jgi:hypothetical protein
MTSDSICESNSPSLVDMLVNFIGRIDAEVFPKEPWKIVVVDEDYPLTEEEKKSINDILKENKIYIRCSKPRKSYIVIKKGIKEFIIEHAKETKHLYAKMAGKKKWDDLPSFTLEELILAIAVHEVRHRVQNEIRMLTPEDEINACDSELGVLIRLASFDKDRAREEYDALVIESLIAKMWHSGIKDWKYIGKIIAEDGEKLLKREQILSFSFFIDKI